MDAQDSTSYRNFNEYLKSSLPQYYEERHGIETQLDLDYIEGIVEGSTQRYSSSSVITKPHERHDRGINSMKERCVSEPNMRNRVWFTESKNQIYYYDSVPNVSKITTQQNKIKKVANIIRRKTIKRKKKNDNKKIEVGKIPLENDTANYNTMKRRGTHKSKKTINGTIKKNTESDMIESHAYNVDTAVKDDEIKNKYGKIIKCKKFIMKTTKTNGANNEMGDRDAHKDDNKNQTKDAKINRKKSIKQNTKFLFKMFKTS